jgi:hypothetical protein
VAIPIVAALIVVWFMLHIHGAAPTPAVPNLTLADVPSGFEVTKSVSQDDAAYAAAQPDTKLSDLHRNGQILFNQVTLSKIVPKSMVVMPIGLVEVNSAVMLFTTATSAKQEYERLVKVFDVLLGSRSIAAVGVQSHGWNYKESYAGATGHNAYVAFWRGRYAVLMFLLTTAPDVDSAQLSKIDHLLDDRLAHAQLTPSPQSRSDGT